MVIAAGAFSARDELEIGALFHVGASPVAELRKEAGEIAATMISEDNDFAFTASLHVLEDGMLIVHLNKQSSNFLQLIKLQMQLLMLTPI